MKYHLIYKITNKINGKIYIGQKSYNDIPSMENYGEQPDGWTLGRIKGRSK